MYYFPFVFFLLFFKFSFFFLLKYKKGINNKKKMPITITNFNVAKFTEKMYSEKKPVFTLFTWGSCGACGPFVSKLQEIMKKRKLNIDIQRVILDDDMEAISKEVRAFPTLRKTYKKQIETFDLMKPGNIEDRLVSFLS